MVLRNDSKEKIRALADDFLAPSPSSKAELLASSNPKSSEKTFGGIMPNRKYKLSLRNTLILSLALHFLVSLFVLFPPIDLSPPPKSNVVEVQYVAPPPAQPRVTPNPKVEKFQVVDQNEKALNDEKVETRFLSAHNQAVKKQTVAANRGEFKNAQKNAVHSGDGGTPHKNLTVEDFKPKFDVAKSIEDHLLQEKAREKNFEEEALKRFENKRTAQRTPSAQKPGSTGAEASQTLDYIKNLDPGLETLLSTKEFVYYTYFSRIRRQLNQHWGPKVREKVSKLYKQGRTIASSEDKVTKLLITLNPKGVLVRVQVIGDSGIRDLDDAAVEAFRAAAPFPNPPSGMVDPDGMIKIRWDFILEA